MMKSDIINVSKEREEIQMNKQYICIEDFPIEFDWWGNRYGKGTIKAGWIYTVVREPTPEKKLYKMVRVTKHGEDTLYIRKSHLKKYFKEITREEEDGEND